MIKGNYLKDKKDLMIEYKSLNINNRITSKGILKKIIQEMYGKNFSYNFEKDLNNESGFLDSIINLAKK